MVKHIDIGGKLLRTRQPTGCTIQKDFSDRWSIEDDVNRGAVALLSSTGG